MEPIVVVCGRRNRALRISQQRLKGRYVEIRALEKNRGPVHIGDASVSRWDPKLEPGRTIGIRGYPVVDVFDLFVTARHAGSGVEVTVR